jgi:hypothetical protein
MPYKFNPFTGTFDDSTPGPAGVVAAANSGTALLPGITFASDPNTGIYNPGADQLAVATNGTERLRIDSSGGATFKGGSIFIEATSDTNNAQISLGRPSSSSAGYIRYINSENALAFRTNGSGEDVRIDSSGRLLVGTSTSVAAGSTTASTLQVSNASGIGATLYSLADSAGPGGVLVLGHGRATAAGLLSSGDVVGQVRFAGGDGGDLVTLAAQISVEVDGTPGANDMPGRLVFSTTADGASSPTEAMRIRNDGQVLIGGSSNTKSGKLEVTGRLAVLNARESIQTGSAVYTASTTATEIIQLDLGGFFGAELFVTFCDGSSPAGTIVQKVYVATRGSGANVTAVSVSQSDILRQTGESGAFTGYLTWTAAVVSNRARLSVTATQTSGAATLTVHCNGSPFTFLI